MCIIDFVTNTPEQNAWMIPVAADPASDILTIPLWEESCIIISGLRSLPHVKSFINDQKSHLIRQFHQFHSGHIVGSPHSIDTHGTHEFKFPAHGFFVKSRSQCSEVMVIAGTVQAHFSAV